MLNLVLVVPKCRILLDVSSLMKGVLLTGGHHELCGAAGRPSAGDSKGAV